MAMRWKDIGRGAAAGVVATLAHTAVMGIAKKRGALGEPPPRKITRAALESAAPAALAHEPALSLATFLSHFGFGAVTGALYAAMNPRPASVTVLSGMRFGTMVWTTSYAGWVPALGIMPMPQNDRRGRPTAMIAAHLAFGAALAMTLRKLRDGAAPEA